MSFLDLLQGDGGAHRLRKLFLQNVLIHLSRGHKVIIVSKLAVLSCGKSSDVELTSHGSLPMLGQNLIFA